MPLLFERANNRPAVFRLLRSPCWSALDREPHEHTFGMPSVIEDHRRSR